MACERHLRAVVLGLALVIAWPGAPAQARELSRDMVVPLALQQNPQVAAARARVAEAEARKAQADTARWPIVSLEAGVGPSLQAELVPGTAVQSTEDAYGDFSFGDLSIFVGGQLTVAQPLYTFGKIGKRQEAAGSEIRARLAQLEVSKADLAVNAVQLYEGHLFARDAQRFFEEALRVVDRVLQDTQDQIDRGNPEVSERDILQLQAARQVVILGMHQAAARKAQALAGLRAYLGLPEDEEIVVHEVELDPISEQVENVERLAQIALERRPELATLLHGSAAYESLAAAEMAGYLPNFFALGFVSAAYTPGRDLVDTRYYVDPLYHFVPGLIIGLQWQIWGSMASARADEAMAQARQLQALRQWAVQGVPAQVSKEYLDAEQALADIETARDGVSSAKKWVVRVAADNAIGLAGTRDVTEAVEAYATLRLAYLDAVYRRNTSLVRLAQATGTLLEQGAGPYGGKQ